MAREDDQTIMMSPIVASMMEAQITQTQSVTNALIDSLTYDAAHQKAALQLVREEIAAITSRPYIVNPQLYLAALWPGEDAIQERMRANGYGKG